MNFTILSFDTLDSTNLEAVRQAKLGAHEGLCIVSEEQTAGRGRHGRQWVSERGSGLYFSVVLRPTIDLRFLSLITLMAGVAVHDSLKEIDVQPDIKWVNDVLAGQKKISGILAETTETSEGLAAVVGIGINLLSQGFPDHIAETATSIEAETGVRVSAAEMSETLTRYLAYFCDTLGGVGGPREILDHWRQRSTYFSGKRVRVTLSDGSFEGETCGLEENGALRVRTADGVVRIIQAGDVERVRMQEAS